MDLSKCLEKKLAVTNGNMTEIADVIIGVGIDVSSDGRGISPQSHSVSYRCQELFIGHLGQNILFTGGYSYRQGPCEAQTMYDSISFPDHIPLSQVFMETESTNTWQNAANTLQLMFRHNWYTAIVVAHPLHARRVRATFRRCWQGSHRSFIIVKASPCPYGGGSQNRLTNFWRFLAWDTAAWLYFRLKGYV